VFQTQLAAAFVGADAWVMPATTTTAPTRDTTGDARLNSVWSYAGVPAIVLPCGIATNDMPVGLQVVGPTGGDEALLAIAAWCEQIVAFDGVPALAAEAD
jgi:aspartyl-tRNA(Asn)/glutamyl-tRNA(Gln) amidotransferase subunit A